MLKESEVALSTLLVLPFYRVLGHKKERVAAIFSGERIGHRPLTALEESESGGDTPCQCYVK